MDNTARPADRTGHKSSSSGALFKKILQAFANGDLPYSDVQSDLQRMLAAGAPPDELRDVLRRYEAVEPLPAYARGEVMRLLDEAAERAALKAAAEAAQGQAQDAPPATAPAANEAAAVSAEARVAAAPGAAPAPRPAAARPPLRGADSAAAPAENVSSIEDRIARQRADYKALNHAYERARDAGSAASARTIALTAELAAVRGALEAEQTKSRTLDQALAEATAAALETRTRGAETRRDLERDRLELRAVRNLLATRDATVEQLRASLEEREEQLAALQRETALAPPRAAPASVLAPLEEELRVERAKSAALAAQLTAARAGLEAEQRKFREADEALREKLAAEERARVSSEGALREAERAHVEMVAVRASLAERDAALAQAQKFLAERDAHIASLQREHARTVAALETRTAISAQLDADLQTALARAAATSADLSAAHAALETERSKARDLQKDVQKKLAESSAGDGAARAQREDLQRKLEGYQAELTKARDALASRQQEHAKRVAELEARAQALEARLQALPARGAGDAESARPGQEITVAIESPRDRARAAAATAAATAAAAAPAAPAVPAVPAVPFASSAASLLGGMRAAVPAAVPGAVGGARFSQARLFGSRGPWTRTRLAGVGAAIAALALLVWVVAHRAPVQEQVTAALSAAAPGPAPGTVIRDCPTCPSVTVVPAGRFKQGSDRTGGSSAFEKPPHWVLIGRPFAMATNTVTVDEFREFIAATGRDMRGCDTYDDRWHVRPDNNWENPGFPQSGSHPVTCVSWDDAKAYAAWLSQTTGHRYRLPSAAEWEYAARAGGQAVQPWNGDGSGACASANVADQRAARRYPGWTVFGCDDGYVYTAPVGSFSANAFGLHDMLGNVFQWTDDCWHADYVGVPVDGSARTYGDCSERELRGGSWFTTPELVRASYRNHFRANFRASTVGIRLIREIGS